MKFKHGTRRRALEYEKDWVQRWKADKTFEKSVEKNPKVRATCFMTGHRLSRVCRIMARC